MATNLKHFEFLRSQERGHVKNGWLESKHTFSFANYYNPFQMHFSDLHVINDDLIDGGNGFPTHPHKDMEIFTYVLEGALAHKDSIGNGETINPGDVQIMSAGSGVRHSEFNPLPNTRTHLLQIWLTPSSDGGIPSYQQQHFNQEEKQGKLKLIISEKGEDNSLTIKQNAKIYAGLFNGEEKAELITQDNRSYYIHVARGSIHVNGLPLNEGDGIKIFYTDVPLLFNNGNQAEVLVFDLVKH